MNIRNVADLKNFLKGCDVIVYESLGYCGNSGAAANAIVVSALVEACCDGNIAPSLFNEILKEGEKK